MAKAHLYRAMGWYFAARYFEGTDRMIGWWQRTYSNLQSCPEKPVEKVSRQIGDQLSELRSQEDYRNILMGRFFANQQLLGNLDGFLDVLDRNVEESMNFYSAGENCGRLFVAIFGFEISPEDC